MTFGSVTLDVVGAPVSTKPGQKSDPTLLTITRPKNGETISGVGAMIEIQVAANITPSSLSAGTKWPQRLLPLLRAVPDAEATLVAMWRSLRLKTACSPVRMF